MTTAAPAIDATELKFESEALPFASVSHTSTSVGAAVSYEVFVHTVNSLNHTIAKLVNELAAWRSSHSEVPAYYDSNRCGSVHTGDYEEENNVLDLKDGEIALRVRCLEAQMDDLPAKLTGLIGNVCDNFITNGKLFEVSAAIVNTSVDQCEFVSRNSYLASSRRPSSARRPWHGLRAMQLP
jgi:hypothetical protein